MKTFKRVLTVVALASLFTSCKDDSYLDRVPLSAIAEPTFFKNETDLRLYANQFYTSLPVQNFIQDNRSDDKVPNSLDPFLAGQYVVPTTDASYNWTNIRNVNYFLQRYNKAEASEVVKNAYAGEVRFFRALFYWSLSKRYGDVPWYSKDLTAESAELYAPRTSRRIVMDSVLADLNFAVEHIPSENVAAGRLHKYAAAALKARVCLWEGTRRKYFNEEGSDTYLREAVSAAEMIMNSDQYSLYSTGNAQSDYYNLFIQQELNNNPEAILPYRYLQSILMNGVSRTLGESGTGYSKNFVRSYLCTDGLPTSLSPLYQGDDTPAAEFANRDPRSYQTIATKGFVLLRNSDGSQDVIDLPRIGTNTANTGYQLIKGRSSDPAMWQANQSTLDFFIFRYAETLLIYAEAKAELGEASQNDIDISINLLRDRVGMPHLQLGTLQKDPNSDFPAIPALIDEIRRERRVELADEGFRFDDLLRWKAGEQIQNPETILGMKLTPQLRAQYPPSQVNGIVVNSNNYVRIYTNVERRTWNDKMYLFPIPLQEIALNPTLGQNPGWQ